MLSRSQKNKLKRRLHRLYGDEAPKLVARFEAMIGRYGIVSEELPASDLWDHRTSVLITYADTIRREGEVPLQTLSVFLTKHIKGVFSTVHLLPFFPWSSDDGFSVIDFRKVNPEYGKWEDITMLGNEFGLMFDLVLNHCSRKSSWFRDFVTGIAPARWYFLPMDPKTDLSQVVRPRPSPLLTRTSTRDGPAHVWTTFSEDQIDLNWQNPDVLFEFLDILFLYLSKGCRIFRLDAVAFLWKKIGTCCLHLPETHELVKLFRDVLDWVAPESILLTETNVPHEENISYFGQNDEAHMVYNFSLPPLLLYSLLKGEPALLADWAKSLPELGPDQAFFNFSASHDGIGVRPLQGIVEQSELEWLTDQVQARGGRVSFKANSDGSKSPYELNITYLDALSDLDDLEIGLRRFLLSQAVVLAFKGVPAVYIHSLLGTSNDYEGMETTGQNRSINRRKWGLDDLNEALNDKESNQARIYHKLSDWLRIRQQHPAFHPGGKMQVLDFGDSVFGFLRTSRTGVEKILCLYNFTAEEQRVSWSDCFPTVTRRKKARELLSREFVLPDGDELVLKPYFAHWLMIKGARAPSRKSARKRSK